MQDKDTNGPEAVLAALAGVGILTALVLLVIWGLCGWIAWIVAPEDRRWTFFWLTFLLFGPLGILAASVASPRDPSYFVHVDERPRATPPQPHPLPRPTAARSSELLKDRKSLHSSGVLTDEEYEKEKRRMLGD